MEHIKSISYNLKNPVTVSNKGTFIEAQSIEIFAPVNSVYKHVNVLDHEYNKAKKELESSVLESIKGITPEQIQNLKNANLTEEKEKPLIAIDVVNEMIKNGADIDRCFEALKEILTSSIKDKPLCLIDTVKLEKSIFDCLSIIDTKEILGLYIISFLGISRSM